MVKKLMKQKKGWTKILEVFVAIVLLASILSLILQDQNQETNNFERIYKKQNTAYQIIQNNNSLRSDVLSGKATKEINSTINNTLAEMDCKAKICPIKKDCNINIDKQQESYAQETILYANETHYKPKKLKSVCW